jgi:hypothetical protein
LFGEIWRFVPIFMGDLCWEWGIGVLDVDGLGRFLVKRLYLGFFRFPVLLYFGVFGLVFGVFRRVWRWFETKKQLCEVQS